MPPVPAGEAVVKISGDPSKLEKALQAVSGKLKSWAGSTAKIGAAVSAAGAAMTAPLLLASKHFAAYGDKLDKMSARTGITAQSLSEIGYAANISGASLEQMEKATAGMSRQLFAANNGSKSVIEALDTMGVSLKDLNAMSEEDKFTTLVDGLANIKDGTTRAGVAMKLFGLNGRYLMNMSGNMGKLRAESRSLGVAMSTSSSKLAADLTDSITRVDYLKNTIIDKIGEAVAPYMVQAEHYVSKFFKTIIETIDKNQSLIAAIGAVGLALGVVGTVIVSMSGIMLGLSVAAGIAASAFAMLTTPAMLIAAALGAGIIIIGKYIGSWSTLKTAIQTSIGGMIASVKSYVSAISEYFAAGDLATAARTAWAGVKLAWQEAKVYLSQLATTLWFSVKEAFYNSSIAEPVIKAYNTIEIGFINLIAKLKELWSGLTNYLSTSALGANLQNKMMVGWGKVYNMLGLIDDKAYEAIKAEAAKPDAVEKILAENNAKASAEKNAIEQERQAAIKAAEAAGQSRLAYANDPVQRAKDLADQLAALAANPDLANARKELEDLKAKANELKIAREKALSDNVATTTQAKSKAVADAVAIKTRSSNITTMMGMFAYSGETGAKKHDKKVEDLLGKIVDNTGNLDGAVF